MEQKRQYLPTLFERLMDDDPKSHGEPYDSFFFNSQAMRKIVRGDILAILNNSNIEQQIDADKYQRVCGSVLNYGVSPMVGEHADAHNWPQIEKAIRHAILRFEPRIIPDSLRVSPVLAKDAPSRHGVVVFEIRGLIFWEPYPLDLCFSGAYDTGMEKISLA
ncbi:type VI secretion system baseplate subunit TssE [Scandinavium goeteborgense]|uniref:type VI secretion system baseplate subunit TssE n=1 Tax=Scandinavium goeteborgense TaxID=1851514 RepID=UPI00381D1F98